MFSTTLYGSDRHAKSLQSCLTLRDPMGYSLPGSSVYGILQVRILEWVSTPSSRYSSYPQFEENETVFEWLSGMPKVKKQLLDSALTCKVGNTVRHSLRYFMCQVLC